jgi:hypothetical protein
MILSYLNETRQQKEAFCDVFGDVVEAVCLFVAGTGAGSLEK